MNTHRSNADVPQPSAIASLVLRSLHAGLAILWLLGCGCMFATPAFAQTDDDAKAAGFLVEVPQPLTAADVDRIFVQLSQWSMAAKRSDGSDQDRTTVVMKMGQSSDDGFERDGEVDVRTTSLEDALKLARAISGSEFKRVRIVAWVDGPVTGHNVLVPLSAETLLVSPGGSIGDAGRDEAEVDETIRVLYQSIARRRALLPPELVAGLVDSDAGVSRVELIDGTNTFLSADDLRDARTDGRVASETTWAEPGTPLVLTADELRQVRAAAAIVGSREAVGDWLGLASLRSETVESTDGSVGRLIRITGAITGPRVRRWQTNLAATVDSPDVNTWLVAIDSAGGSLTRSVSLAAALADPGPSIRTVGGYVTGEARGDAALIAMACKPLMMAPETKLGGGGADAMSPADVRAQSELIALIAQATGRSEALLRGMMDPSLSVHRYVHRKTGRIRYAVPQEETERAEAAESQDDLALNDDWKREERIDLADGVTIARAIELGLAEETVDSMAAAAAAIGLPEVPAELSDRGVIRFVERIGSNTGLAFTLLLIGFVMLSTEASAPGLGVPGFLAMVCFGLFFWIKFLAGTAEWAELLAFVLGLACIGIEIFVLPGFGIFGIGGLTLTVLGILLMSQTFVVPQNAYQVGELTRGLWVAIGGLGGCVVGMVAMRAYLPRAATMTGLAMGVPEPEIDHSERVTHYEFLLGQTGVATTPLRPSGKARFGETLVGVVSDATSIDSGTSIRVIQVLGNRITVEEITDPTADSTEEAG